MSLPAIVDTAWHPLADGNPPAWASGWGRDRYGVFVDVTLDEVTQCLRWIPPGPFLMGAPEGEPGRSADEGPQHRVILSRGFWLCDTPCTQALWQAVTGGNPSRFKSPDRPVEQVTRDDVQGFLSRINRRSPGLELTLPTEAQWEYACRADTTTALYAGDMVIRGQCDAPALDAIAWYAGNSGVGFDLPGGEDSRYWQQTQYQHEQAGSHPVARKRPNDWGLYDMLGNVWEWCLDGPRTYQDRPAIDPHGLPAHPDKDRVLRGGSWSSIARRVRAAYRYRHHPAYGSHDIGFRCAHAPS